MLMANIGKHLFRITASCWIIPQYKNSNTNCPRPNATVPEMAISNLLHVNPCFFIFCIVRIKLSTAIVINNA